MNKIVISILTFIIFIILVILNRMELLSTKVFIGIIAFILIGILLYLSVKLVEMKNKNLNDSSEQNKKSISTVLERINKELSNSPGGDVLTWKGGIGNFYRTQRHLDENRKPHEIKAIYGEYKTTGHAMIIYYDSTEDKILNIIGDLNPQIIAHPFRDFELVKQDRTFMNNDIEKYKKKNRRNGIRIIPENTDDVDDYVSQINQSKAMENLDE